MQLKEFTEARDNAIIELSKVKSEAAPQKETLYNGSDFITAIFDWAVKNCFDKNGNFIEVKRGILGWPRIIKYGLFLRKVILSLFSRFKSRN